MKICNEYVMDETDKNIIFDDRGVSDMFRSLKSITKYKERSRNTNEIESLISRIKKHKGQYNCLIGLSGGIDSSYVALLAKKWGLNPLCLHFDNGWNSDISVKNIRNIIKHTGFDYETVVIYWQNSNHYREHIFMRGC